MTVATVQRVHLSESLQSLIDSRLDTIDRMLLGRVARGERMSIVREVESQIHELLGEREADELSREDVLAVLARLDPPEAFLAERFEEHAPTATRSGGRFPVRSAQHKNRGAAKVSGVLGVIALSLLFLLPVSYVPAMLFKSELPLVLAAAGTSLGMFICSVIAIAMGFHARKDGAWAVVGIITGLLALPFSCVIGIGLVLIM